MYSSLCHINLANKSFEGKRCHTLCICAQDNYRQTSPGIAHCLTSGYVLSYF